MPSALSSPPPRATLLLSRAGVRRRPAARSTRSPRRLTVARRGGRRRWARPRRVGGGGPSSARRSPSSSPSSTPVELLLQISVELDFPGPAAGRAVRGRHRRLRAHLARVPPSETPRRGGGRGGGGRGVWRHGHESWIFAWLDSGKRRYLVYAAIYLAPYLRTNLLLSPDESWLPVASIFICILHVQLEAAVRNGDIESFKLVESRARPLATARKYSRQAYLQKRRDKKIQEIRDEIFQDVKLTEAEEGVQVVIQIVLLK